MRHAWLAGLLIACGDGRVAPDATAVDADEHRGLVSVQFLTDGLSAGGLEVYFQNADSSLVLATRTLDDGTANAFMASGGFVTVASSVNLWTFTDVQVGDHLVIDQRSQGGNLTPLQLRLPPSPANSFVTLQTTCGNADATLAGTGVISIVLGNCQHSADLLAIAATDVLDEYLYRDSVPIEPGTTILIDTPYRAVDSSTIEVVHAPFAGVLTAQAVVGTHGPVYQTQLFAQPVDGAATQTTAMPLPSGTRLVTDVSSFDFTGLAVQHVVRWAPSVPLTQIDLAEQIYPVTSQPVYEPATHAIRWTEQPEGLVPNAALVAMSFDFSQTWWIAAARGADPVVQLPVLPGTAHTPRFQISVFQLVDIAADGGYPQLRQRLPGWSSGTPWPIEGDTGHVVYEVLSGFGPVK